MYNIESTVLSQFANSPSITALIADFQPWIDPTVNLQDFYNIWWNIDTATGQGLDNWGEILGISRYLLVPAVGQYIGFYNTENDYVPMSQGPFFSGGSLTSTYALGDASYRMLLLAKALSNITSCSIQALNALAQLVFGTGAMYVLDLGNMEMAYYFTSVPSLVQQSIAANSGVLPHPTGVLEFILSPISAWTWTFTGNGSGSQYTVNKSGGVSSWDSSAYVNTSFPQMSLGCTIGGTLSESFMIGGAANPTAFPSNTYESLTYGLFCSSTGLQVWNAGTMVASVGTYAIGDTITVYPNGTTVTYFHNNVLIYSVPQTVTPLYPMIALLTPGATANSLIIST